MYIFIIAHFGLKVKYYFLGLFLTFFGGLPLLVP